ncbi:prepilin-type N-terminal cleavage/methylation domain-containing protein [Sinimarinibacterium sp. CAU 1509]|nr:prepilin-type N-terminal cleavage/methylation domain-containing protein [Sinimarinibacterium sp. CAU 1509]
MQQSHLHQELPVHRQAQTGFTLIEVMIVAAVVAILAAIAIPSYDRAMRKTRRADAQAALVNMQLLQEKWRTNNSTYSSDATQVGAPASTTTVYKYYTFSVPTATASTFTVQAASIAGMGQQNDTQSGTSCATLTVDQSGTRSPANCW